jgi:hypothetical protein
VNLRLIEDKGTKHVSPQTALDYERFTNSFHGTRDEREIDFFERFVAASRLVREGYDTYLDPLLTSDSDSTSFHPDAGGIRGNEVMAAFCTSGVPSQQVWNAIMQVSHSENAKALVFSFAGIEAPDKISERKVRFETLGWFDDTLEKTLRETLRTIELLVNETRMRMLAPLLQKSALKKEFRARINPKLVYHNIDALSKAGILDEPTEGTYELSQLGKTVLAEFIVFLEKTRRTLDDQRNEEVKSIGRR